MNQTEKQYREDSPIAQNREMVTKMVEGHWDYVENVINAGIDVTRLWDHDELMEIRKWDYTSAAYHFYGHGFEDASNSLVKDEGTPFHAIVQEQKIWAMKTFGEGMHTAGLLKHIGKECNEIHRAPYDTEEWCDVLILAMEGAWRSGVSPKEVEAILKEKLRKIQLRSYPAATDRVDGEPIEHLRAS